MNNYDDFDQDHAHPLDCPGVVAILGWGKSGQAAAAALVQRKFRVVGFDQNEPVNRGGTDQEKILADIPVHVCPSEEEMAEALLQVDPSLVVVSPGIAPHHLAWKAAHNHGLPVWGEAELAWQLQERGPHAGRPWLTVTGTNGKTTTTGMLASILAANGERVQAVGNIGQPITQVIDSDADVFAVELSSFQLASSQSVSAQASVCLNVDADHLDWHETQENYAAAKARVYEHTQVACVYPAQDRRVERMVEEADVVEGARAIGITLGIPAPSQVGIVDGDLVDRAFVPRRFHEAQLLASLEDLTHLSGKHPSAAILWDALAAAALARAHGVSPQAVSDGLRTYQSAPHRRAVIAQAADLTWIDDSKATNAHAARASLSGIPAGTAIWIAGGDAKGQRFDDLVSTVAPLLRGVVLIGVDRAPLREALQAQAPHIPVVEVDGHEDWMFSVVNEAVALSRPGDTVVLAPATASWDQFAHYGQRGDAFRDAVERLAQQWAQS